MVSVNDKRFTKKMGITAKSHPAATYSKNPTVGTNSRPQDRAAYEKLSQEQKEAGAKLGLSVAQTVELSQQNAYDILGNLERNGTRDIGKLKNIYGNVTELRAMQAGRAGNSPLDRQKYIESVSKKGYAGITPGSTNKAERVETYADPNSRISRITAYNPITKRVEISSSALANLAKSVLTRGDAIAVSRFASTATTPENRARVQKAREYVLNSTEGADREYYKRKFLEVDTAARKQKEAARTEQKKSQAKDSKYSLPQQTLTAEEQRRLMQNVSVLPQKRESASETLGRFANDIGAKVNAHIESANQITNMVRGVDPEKRPSKVGKVRDTTTGDSWKETLERIAEDMNYRPASAVATGLETYYTSKIAIGGITAGTTLARQGLKAAAKKASTNALKTTLSTGEKLVVPATTATLLGAMGKEAIDTVNSGDKERQIGFTRDLVIGGAAFRGGTRLGMKPTDIVRTRGRKEIPVKEIIKDEPTLKGKRQFPVVDPGTTPQSFPKTFKAKNGEVRGYHASAGSLGKQAVVAGEVTRKTDVPGLYMAGNKTGASPYFLRVGGEGIGYGGYISSAAAFARDVAAIEKKLLLHPMQFIAETASKIKNPEYRKSIPEKVKRAGTAILGESTPIEPTIHDIKVKGVKRVPKEARGKLKPTQDFLLSDQALKNFAYLTYRMERGLAEKSRPEAEAVLPPGASLIRDEAGKTGFIKYEGRRIPIDKYNLEKPKKTSKPGSPKKEKVSEIEELQTLEELLRPRKSPKVRPTVRSRASTKTRARTTERSRSRAETRDRERDRDRTENRERDRERDRRKTRERDRERNRERDRTRESERTRERDRTREKERARNRDRTKTRDRKTKEEKPVPPTKTKLQGSKIKKEAARVTMKDSKLVKNAWGGMGSFFGGNGNINNTKASKGKKRKK